MPNKTLYIPSEGEWQAWKDSAWKARLSVSEYIRRAVEAYRPEVGGEDDPRRCGAIHPERPFRCVFEAGHDGAHEHAAVGFWFSSSGVVAG